MPGKELAVVKNKETALAHPLEFSSDQVRILAETVAKGCDQNELGFFLNVCRLKRLDPFTSQVHCVKRWDSDLGREKMTIQVGIDGLRVTAVRTGELAGISEPEYDSEDEQHPNWSRVTVWRYGRSDEKIAYTVKARWAEYVQTKKDGNPNRMWSKMPYIMLSKCAEALALRKAFPDELSGMYSDEEMGQADNEGTTAPASVAKAPVQMPKSIDEKKQPPRAQTQSTANPLQQAAQAGPPLTDVAKIIEISGEIGKNGRGKGKMEGALFMFIGEKMVAIPKDKVTDEMVEGNKIAVKAVPTKSGKAFEAVEVLMVQPKVEIEEGEIIEEEPPNEFSGLFDEEPQRETQKTMEPAPATTSTKRGTIGIKRAQRLYTLRSQNQKRTELTEEKLKEILKNLPEPIEHLRDLETGMYETFEQICMGEEDWRPYLQ